MLGAHPGPSRAHVQSAPKGGRGGYARLTLAGYARGTFSKYQAIFRSRWRALFWASGVLLTAYCTVPSEDGSDPAMELLQTAASYAPKKAPPRHVNPWALHKPPAEE